MLFCPFESQRSFPLKKYPVIMALFSLTVSMPAVADTIKLKDGTEVEGEIVSETADSYLLEIQVSKTIKDERKVLKSDVTDVILEPPDIKAYKSISGMMPTPDLLTDEEYGRRILAVQKFLKNFPTSAKSAEVKAMLVTIKDESTQVASGGIKLNGSMVSPSEYKLNAYDLDSRVEAAKIRNYVERNQYLVALRVYADFCRDFESTNANQALIPLMLDVIQTHAAEANQALLTLDERVKKRMNGLEQMASDDRKLSENAIREEDAAIEARLKAEQDGKQIWVTPHPFNKASLEETVKTGEAEIKRLSALTNTLGLDGGRAWRDALAIIRSSKNPTTVTAAITAAKAAGVSAKYMSMLENTAKYSK